MNRDELIARAGGVVYDWKDCSLDPFLNEENARTMGRDVVNALLPQVTTVAELEALPEGTLLVSDSGNVREWSQWRSAEVLLKTHGPLTVVWSPS